MRIMANDNSKKTIEKQNLKKKKPKYLRLTIVANILDTFKNNCLISVLYFQNIVVSHWTPWYDMQM